MIFRALLALTLPALLQAEDGLAARYPGDRGITRDKRVLLAEDFERGRLADLSKRWESVSNKRDKALAFVEDGPGASRRALEMIATLGENTGAHLYTRLKRPVETAYARFYVKFAERPGYIHHFVHMGGYFPATSWPQGGAGERPRGDERFTAGIEPHGNWGRARPPGEWTFYAYWHEMKAAPDGKFWGNTFKPDRPAPAPRATWQCVEFMIRCNTPGRRDGELALWLDGKQRGHFRKISWRKDERLKVNFFWLLHYVTEGALRRNRVKDPPRENRVRFDHVVVATSYIGPLAKPRR